jgi:hypothetical protein
VSKEFDKTLSLSFFLPDLLFLMVFFTCFEYPQNIIHLNEIPDQLKPKLCPESCTD